VNTVSSLVERIALVRQAEVARGLSGAFANPDGNGGSSTARPIEIIHLVESLIVHFRLSVLCSIMFKRTGKAGWSKMQFL
jgi:hypothetical protein